MNKGLVIGGLAAAGLLLAASASSSKPRATARPDLAVRGFPIDLSALKLHVQWRSQPQKYSQQLMNWLKAPTIQVALSQVNDRIRNDWFVARDEFKRRRTLLPKDALGSIDKYSKERYQLPPSSFADPWPKGLWVDEFGREPQGLPSNFGTTFLQVAQDVAPMIPGVGSGASAALAFTIAIGQGKSFKDASLSAARAALPPQYRYAFDLGVGIANGQGVDTAAKEAFFQQVPGSREAYAEGEALAKKAGVT